MERDGTDFRRDAGFVTDQLKTTDQVVHERMAERPFLPFERFRIASFVDMGVKHYDDHHDGCRDPNQRHGTETSVRRYARRPATRSNPRAQVVTTQD